MTNIPEGYDRARDHGPGYINLWMNEIESQLDGQRISGIVDIGCGTGRFSEGLAARFGTIVYGVDPSNKMLEQALAKKCDDRVQYMIGRAESIPLPSQSVDMILKILTLQYVNAGACFAIRELLFYVPGLLSRYHFIPMFRSILPAVPYLKSFS